MISVEEWIKRWEEGLARDHTRNAPSVAARLGWTSAVGGNAVGAATQAERSRCDNLSKVSGLVRGGW